MPVYSDVRSESDRDGVGRRIREQRQKRGWILQDLALRVGVSVASLSAIENRKVSLGTELLLGIAQALDVPLEELLPRSRSCHFWISRQSDAGDPPVAMKVVNRATGTLISYHNRVRPLAAAFAGKRIEPFEIEIHAVPDPRVRFISHHDEEFAFILEGEVECLLKTPEGLLRETLAAGDCISFWSCLPHCLRAIGRAPARAIDLVCSADGPSDSELGDGGPIYLADASRKYLPQLIAARMLALRRARGMSITEFGRVIGVSPRRLASIERGEKPVTLELLLEICRRFGKPKEYFLAGSFIGRPFYEVVRAAALNPAAGREATALRCVRGAQSRPLATGFPGRGMAPALLQIERNDGSRRLTGHRGQEFLYVLRGGIQLLTTQDRQPVARTLLAGDACFLDGHVPHGFVQTRGGPYDDNRPAQVLRVSWEPRRDGQEW
jgi:transcriptional regulator with XRE-family HTH domain